MERLKVTDPWCKYGYSFPSIAWPTNGVGVMAPLLHACPTFVLRACGVARSVAVFSNFFHGLVNKCAAKELHPFLGKASTGLSLSASELPGPGNFLVTALALAKPSTALSRWRKYWANDSQPSVNMSREVNFIHDGIIPFNYYGVQA